MADRKRCLIIVLDGVGIGALPDAYRYGDEGSHTLANLARAVGGLKLPNLQALGLGNIDSIKGLPPAPNPQAAYGKMAEKSPGKDSTSGHWELGGLALNFDFPTYPDGFPPEILDPFCQIVKRGYLGNKPASGTEIIKELGEEHIRTGNLIVYTSADSVFQIAAHEEIVPLAELYRICQTARELLTEPHAVGRVIARPFLGKSAVDFYRTPHRKDFSVLPPRDTILSAAKKAGIFTKGIGKTDDLFAHVGLCDSDHTTTNEAGIKATIATMQTLEAGLVFTNLVEFDMLWGHRNDGPGFYRALQDFDHQLPAIIAALQPGDLMIISADHGVDPTTASTDHSREYVPVLAYGHRAINLGTRPTFADVGATVGEFLGIDFRGTGASFWPEIRSS